MWDGGHTVLYEKINNGTYEKFLTSLCTVISLSNGGMVQISEGSRAACATETDVNLEVARVSLEHSACFRPEGFVM